MFNRLVLRGARVKKGSIAVTTFLLSLFFLVTSLQAMSLWTNSIERPPEQDVDGPHIFTLEGMQNTNCDPSWFVLTNANDNAATTVLSFYDQEDLVTLTVGTNIGASNQITVDLAAEALPIGYEGYVVVSSDLPLSGIVLPDDLIADFSVNATNGIAPMQVDFANHACGDYSDLYWDFGDRVISTQSSPSYTYTIPGIYTATLSISNAIDSDVGSIQIQVNYGLFLPQINR